MKTIYDVITPEFTGVRLTETAEDRVPYLLEAFFPDESQLGI